MENKETKAITNPQAVEAVKSLVDWLNTDWSETLKSTVDGMAATVAAVSELQQCGGDAGGNLPIISELFQSVTVMAEYLQPLAKFNADQL